MSDLDLRIRIRAELEQARKALASITSELENVGDSASAAGGDFGKIQNELDATGQAAISVVSGVDALKDELSDTGSEANTAARGFDGVQGELDATAAAAQRAGAALSDVQQEMQQTGGAAKSAAAGLDDAAAAAERNAKAADDAADSKRRLGDEEARAGEEARKKAREADKAAAAAEREKSAAHELADSLRNQAAAYGLTGSKLIELNKQRDLAKIKTEQERRAVAAAYDELIRKARQAEQEQARASGAMSNALNGVAASVAGILSAYTAIQAVSGIARITDQYATYNAQLKLTTNSADELATAQAEVFRIAQLTRAPVQDTASVYATLQRSTERLGKSQAEVVNVLETVNKAVALTPVSAETASATLVQFGQALSGDFKNGAQEINSILEQTPGLAIAIAEGLGTTTDQLKVMGEAGELSAELVFLALQRVSTRVDEDFAKMPATVGGALTQLRNDIVVTFGTLDTTPLTDAIGELRDTLTDPAVVQGLSTLAAGLVRLVSLAAEAAAEFADLGVQIGYAFADTTELDELERKLLNIKRATNNSFMGKPIGYLFTSKEDLEAERKAIEAQIAALKKADGAAQESAAKNGKTLTPERRKELAEEAAAEQEKARAAAERKKQEEAAAKVAEQNKKQVADTIKSLEEQAATYGKSAEETVRYQLAQKNATQDEIDRAVAATAKVEALKNGEEAEKQAAQAAKESAREAKRAAEERAEAEKKLADEMEQVNIRLLQASGQDVDARTAQLERQYDDLIARLLAKGDVAGIELVTKLINLEVSSERLAQLREQIADVLDDLKNAEQSADARVSTGEITPAQGREEVQAARDDALPRLQALGIELAALEAQGVPGATEALDELEKKLATVTAQADSGTTRAIKSLRAELNAMQQDMVSSAAGSAVDALADSFMNIASGTQTASEGINSFAASFAASVAQMMARALALQAILAALQFIPGGAAVASALGASANVRHTGGIAGRGGVSRRVPSFVFAAAPRYHVGGVAGLKPGEVPAILQAGEEVLTENDPRHVANGGKQQQNGGGGVRILNVVDPGLVADYLSSSAGEETIINTIQRNAGSIKQVLY